MKKFHFDTKATFINYGPSGVCHYRTMLPAQELRANIFVRYDKTNEVLKRGAAPESLPVAIYSMPRNPNMIRECRELLAGGTKLIIDVDDDLAAVCARPDHPAREFFFEILPEHDQIMREATALTTSTLHLRDKLLALNPNVFLCPNGIDLDRFSARRQPRHDDTTIIGWSGSYGHAEALERISPVINRILRERGGSVAFATAGLPFMPYADPDVAHLVVDSGYHPLFAHPKVITQFPINIGPTMDDDFYRAKSSLRALESWACDSAFIGGRNTYAGTVTNEEDGLLADSLDEWEWQLNRIVDDKALQVRLRRNGMNKLKEMHTIRETAPSWRKAIDESVLLP